MFNKEFYPTPENLVLKMYKKMKFSWNYRPKYILEPSAGAGNIIDIFSSKNKEKFSVDFSEYDCIEISPELRGVLESKNYKVVANDFLKFDTFKRYDAIIMNPPFSSGATHLLKAIDMMQHGGKIVCVLNAETIKNPYTAERKTLINKLDELGANIEYLQDEFVKAERKTKVEIALILIEIEKETEKSDIFKNLKKSHILSEQQKEKSNFDKFSKSGEISKGNIFESLVESYDMELQLGIKLIDEYNSLKKLQINESSCAVNFLELKLGKKDATVNSYIKQVREKYWGTIMQTEKFCQLMTNDIYRVYMSKLEDLTCYDVTLPNIYQMLIDLSKQTSKSIEKAILDLFEKFTYNFSLSTIGNIHYFTGWKTNKAYIVNRKVVVPYMVGFDDLFKRWCYYGIERNLLEVEKVFNYLDNGKTPEINLHEVLYMAQECQQSKNIHLKYFNVDFYKKGTAHLTFTNEELLKKFNLFGCQRKGWLPPSFGKKAYDDMTPEEQSVVDELGGKSEYDKIVLNKEYYLPKTKMMLISE